MRWGDAAQGPVKPHKPIRQAMGGKRDQATSDETKGKHATFADTRELYLWLYCINKQHANLTEKPTTCITQTALRWRSIHTLKYNPSRV